MFAKVDPGFISDQACFYGVNATSLTLLIKYSDFLHELNIADMYTIWPFMRAEVRLVRLFSPRT